MMMPAVFDMTNLLFLSARDGQDRSKIEFAAAHEKMTMGIRAKVTALLIEHPRTTNRTTLPPALRRVVVIVSWF